MFSFHVNWQDVGTFTMFYQVFFQWELASFFLRTELTREKA